MVSARKRKKRRRRDRKLGDCVRQFLTPAVWKQVQNGMVRPWRASRWRLQPLVMVLVLMTFASHALAQEVTGVLRALLQQLSIRTHFMDFVRGLVDLNHVVFFLTTTVFFLFLTVKWLEMRRWR